MLKNICRGLAICMAMLLALSQMAVSAQINKLTKVTECHNYDEVGVGVDKNSNIVRVGVTQTGSVLTFSILDGNFKPTYSFVVNNVAKFDPNQEHGRDIALSDIRLWLSELYVNIVQGLLDDEDKWVACVYEGDSGDFALVDEDGEIYLTNPPSCYLDMIGGVWYITDYDDYYTLRTKDRPSAVNEISEADAEHIKGIYTLDGVKTDRAKKGLYIINGKKVVK